MRRMRRGAAPNCDSGLMRHVLRFRRGPDHAALLHPGGDDVLAGTLHGAAANRQMLISVLPVVHALAIRFEVVDLALDQVALPGASGSVAQLLQLGDQLGSPALAQLGAPALEAFMEAIAPLPSRTLHTSAR